MPAIGMTDHGNMFGASEFYNAATDVGIKPIIGVEAYIAPASRFDTKPRPLGLIPARESDDVSGSGAYTHMTMVARTRPGCATCSSSRRWPRSRASWASGRGWTPS